NKFSPARLAAKSYHQRRGQKSSSGSESDPGPHFSATTFFGSGILGAETCFHLGPERLERSRISLEIYQGRSFQNMDAFDRVLQGRMQFAPRTPPNDLRQIRVRPRSDPDLHFPNPEFFQ